MDELIFVRAFTSTSFLLRPNSSAARTVTAFASPTTVEHIKATAQKKLEVWGERLGKNITSNVILPQVLKGNSIELEGQKLEIIGLEEFSNKTFIWIPSIKAVVGGINVFGTTFNLWMADAQTPEARKSWVSVLDVIAALNPEIVIPAHANTNSPFNIAALNHTKSYIQFYEEALKKAGVSFQTFMYDGVNHAFHNDTSAERYNAATAKQAWARTVAFLKANLA